MGKSLALVLAARKRIKKRCYIRRVSQPSWVSHLDAELLMKFYTPYNTGHSHRVVVMLPPQTCASILLSLVPSGRWERVVDDMYIGRISKSELEVLTLHPVIQRITLP